MSDTGTPSPLVVVNTAEPEAQPPVNNGPSPEEAFAEAVQKARREEKEKLYPEINELKEQLGVLTRERDEREAARLEAEKAAAEEAKRRQEEEMSLRDLVNQREQEFEAKYQELNQRFQVAEAARQKTEQLLALDHYRTQRLAEMSDQIVPQLQDLVRGDTPEEIEASIADMVTRSNQIFEDVQAAQQAGGARPPVVPVTGGPSVGPEDMLPGQETITAEEIAAMSMDEFRAKRSQLLAAATQSARDGRLYQP